MLGRRALRVGVTVAAVTAAAVGTPFWWSRHRSSTAARFVLVEGRDLNPLGQAQAGMGIIGTLGLVGDRCVGLNSKDVSVRVIVWPHDTEVSGSGMDVRITSEEGDRPLGRPDRRRHTRAHQISLLRRAASESV